ncbi:MAG: hypothetical protein LBU66_00510 [Treponema sp.]|jgi:hypothetical protein|nr:hypothetical protein [Treponema sp.]
MKKYLLALALILAFVLLAGCITTHTYQIGAVTDNAAVKHGEGPATGGIVAVANAAGITKIATVDLRTSATYFLGYYLIKVEQTWIVSGE